MLITSLVSFFAPANCLVCGREGSLLCPGCPLPEPRYGRCLFCHGRAEAIACPDCLAANQLASVAAAARYAGPAEELVAKLKYQGDRSAAHLMAARMLPLLPPDGVLVPIPATLEHIRQRGFDQAQLIARHLSRRSGLPVSPVLARAGKHHQKGSDKATRHAAMSDALSATRPIYGSVILIDDVLTTGATMSAAAQLLIQAGAESVCGIAFSQA